MAFSPNGRILASGGWDTTIRLWDMATKKEHHAFKGHKRFVMSVAFSPDGRMLISGSEDRTVRLWEVASGKEIREFIGHDDEVTTVAFSPDGKMIASGGRDYNILIWDPRGQKEKPVSKGVNALWNDLANDDASKSHEAIWALVSIPEIAVPFLQAHLHPVPLVASNRIAQLVVELDSDEFQRRETATAELERLGDVAITELHQALAKKPSPEVQTRVNSLLSKLEGQMTSPNQLRDLRALKVLEEIGTPEAQQVLKKLAAGEPKAFFTQEAKSSLERLTKRSARSR